MEQIHCLPFTGASSSLKHSMWYHLVHLSHCTMPLRGSLGILQVQYILSCSRGATGRMDRATGRMDRATGSMDRATGSMGHGCACDLLEESTLTDPSFPTCGKPCHLLGLKAIDEVIPHCGDVPPANCWVASSWQFHCCSNSKQATGRGVILHMAVCYLEGDYILLRS